MRFLPLIFRNIVRSRRRTLLTGAGIALSVFVISALLSVNAGFAALGRSTGDSLLAVHEKGVACPVTGRVFDSYLRDILSTPGVVAATGVLRGIYSYQDKEKLVLVAGVDFESFRRVKGLQIREGSEQAFLARSDAALVGVRVASRYGWKVGQTLSMVEDRLTFQVAGIFDSDDASQQGGVLLHKSFLQKVKRDEGKSTFLIVRVADQASVPTVSRAIDSAFANFPKATKTQSEKAAKEEELRDFLEVRWMLSGMVLATLVASVFGAANSVSMSVRERTREVGILRGLGLRKSHILQIVLGEAVIVAAAGGALGLAGAVLFIGSEKSLGGYVPLVLGPSYALGAFLIALLIGLGGALLPAVRASRSPIVTALRVVD